MSLIHISSTCSKWNMGNNFDFLYHTFKLIFDIKINFENKILIFLTQMTHVTAPQLSSKKLFDQHQIFTAS